MKRDIVTVKLSYDDTGLVNGAIAIDITDDPTNMVNNPLDPTKQIQRKDQMAILAANPALRTFAGWDDHTNLPGHPDGTTIFDVLVAESKTLRASTALKAIAAVHVP